MADQLLVWAQLLEDEVMFGFGEILHAEVDQSECELKEDKSVVTCPSPRLRLAMVNAALLSCSCAFLLRAWGGSEVLVFATLPGLCLRRFFSSTAFSFSTVAMLRDGETRGQRPRDSWAGCNICLWMSSPGAACSSGGEAWWRMLSATAAASSAPE